VGEHELQRGRLDGHTMALSDRLDPLHLGGDFWRRWLVLESVSKGKV
jgi:hypothetical protein